MTFSEKRFNYYRNPKKNHILFQDGMRLTVKNGDNGRLFTLTKDERKENTRILNKVNEDINKRRTEKEEKDDID